MQKRRLWRSVKVGLLAVLMASGAFTGTVFAETSQSSKYQATDMQFGSSSALESCSGQYCATATIGDMTEGGTGKSPVTSAAFGSITNSDPFLEVIVDPGVSNLGVLTTEQTATKTTTVRVRNYLSNGYMLQIVGTPPKYGSHTLNAPGSPTTSQPGTEQFAINAAANTTPAVGAGPQQIPSDQLSFGVVEEDYATPNLFKFASGDVIARSLTESGRTDYTISMIVNVSSATPAGHFSGDFSAVVIPVF